MVLQESVNPSAISGIFIVGSHVTDVGGRRSLLDPVLPTRRHFLRNTADNSMANSGFVPATPGTSSPFPPPVAPPVSSHGAPQGGPAPAPEPTWRRVGRAWSHLGAQRRFLAFTGTAAALGCGLAATAVAPVTSAIAITLVGILAGAAAVVDVHEHRLPNRLLSLSLAIVAIAAAIDGVWTLVDVVVGLAMAALPLWAVRYGKGLALGDVKFAAVLGAATGLVHPFAGVVVVWVAALAGGVFALRTGRRRLAFGPWLWAGYLTAGLAAVVFVQFVLEMGGRTWPARP